MVRIDVIPIIRVGVDMIKIDLIQNYRIFAPIFFNFEIIIALSIFENDVVSRVFNAGFYCAMPRIAPVIEIRRPSVKESKTPDVSWWDLSPLLRTIFLFLSISVTLSRLVVCGVILSMVLDGL